MSARLQVTVVTVVLAVILDLYIVFGLRKSRSLKKERESAGVISTGRQAIKNWIKSVRSFLTELWRNLWLNEHRAVQVVVAISAIMASIFVGTTYAGEIVIPIFPIIFWLIEIIICCVMLYPNQRKGEFRFSPVWPGLLALLVVAFLLRFVGLAGLPPGFHTDEYGTAEFVQLQVLNPLNDGKTINPFIIDSNYQPAFYDYIWRFSIGLFGFSTTGARMSSVIAGTLAIAAVFLMVNEMVGRRMAWLTAILMAVYHYHIHWSRIALDNIWVTFWLPLTFTLFLRGWHKGWSGYAVLAGLCLGFTAYFYIGGYIVLFLLPILMWQKWKKSENRISLVIYCGKMLAVALVVAAPLFVYAVRFPEHFFNHTHEIFAWTPGYAQATLGLSATTWDFFLFQVGHSFGAFNYYLDITGFYQPCIPFLVGFASALFLWGAAWTLYKKQYFSLIWIVLVAVLGGVMSAGTPGSSHFIGAIPAICWLVAIPLDWLAGNNRIRWAYVLLVIIILTDLIFYFMVYKSNPSPDLILKFPLIEPYLP